MHWRTPCYREVALPTLVCPHPSRLYLTGWRPRPAHSAVLTADEDDVEYHPLGVPTIYVVTLLPVFVAMAAHAYWKLAMS